MNTDTDHDERTDRIIQVAMELAEQDGYDAVRLRDLAEKADVALGTVYRRFSSKEDILAAALERMVQQFLSMVRESTIPGDSPAERLETFFQIATGALAERPRLAAALLRTVASGIPELANRVLSYQGTMQAILRIVLRGTGGVVDADGELALDAIEATEEEDFLCQVLQNLWFAHLVGWTGGILEPDAVVDRMRTAIRRLIRGPETT